MSPASDSPEGAPRVGSTPLEQPAAWVGWRRRRDDLRAAWEKVPGVEPGTKAEVYQRLVLIDLHAVEKWQYEILPEGKRPADGPAWAQRGRARSQ